MAQQSAFIQLPSISMQTIYNKIQKTAASNIPFLITGEIGVGKESIAHYIHESGPRGNQPFVAINCDRFSPTRLHSEIFGHEPDAFRGATYQHRGAFEVANGGFIFLNNILKMPLDAQERLLRFLDTKRFTRFGGGEILTADVRIIAATSENIVKAVAKKKFSEPLYYRLDDMTLHVPPLRERAEDIEPLVTPCAN